MVRLVHHSYSTTLVQPFACAKTILVCMVSQERHNHTYALYHRVMPPSPVHKGPSGKRRPQVSPPSSSRITPCSTPHRVKSIDQDTFRVVPDKLGVSEGSELISIRHYPGTVMTNASPGIMALRGLKCGRHRPKGFLLTGPLFARSTSLGNCNFIKPSCGWF